MKYLENSVFDKRFLHKIENWELHWVREPREVEQKTDYGYMYSRTIKNGHTLQIFCLFLLNIFSSEKRGRETQWFPDLP